MKQNNNNNNNNDVNAFAVGTAVWQGLITY
jgi:hypothetical protein